MKKLLIIIPFLGILLSCSGEKKQTETTNEELQEQIETIEKTTQQLDETIKSSIDELEKHQNEIDSLLNNL